MIGRVAGRMSATIVTALGMCTLVGQGAAQAGPHATEDIVRTRQFRMPDTSRFRIVLENGLVGFVVPDHSAPVVRLTAFVRGGYADADKRGAARMLEWALRHRGPCWLGPSRLDQSLEAMTADLTVLMGPELMEISLTADASEARRAMRMFSGVVRETCIEPEGIEAFRREEQGGAVDSVDAPTAAARLFGRVLFRDHEYRRDLSPEEVDGFDVDDVERFYRRYFNPASVTLSISGAFDMNDMALSVDQRFADWEWHRPPRLSRADNIRTPEPGTVTRTTVAIPEDQVVMGHELPRLEPRELTAVQVLNYILAGSSESRVGRVVLGPSGPAFDVLGVVTPRVRGPGSVTVRAVTRPGLADSVVGMIRMAIESLQVESVTDGELQAAREALADREFRRRFRTGTAIARTFALEWTRYLTFDYLVRYPRWIRAVDSKDVRRAAQRYLHPDRMLVVILDSGL